jgi:hypothetical protein
VSRSRSFQQKSRTGPDLTGARDDGGRQDRIRSHSDRGQLWRARGPKLSAFARVRACSAAQVRVLLIDRSKRKSCGDRAASSTRRRRHGGTAVLRWRASDERAVWLITCASLGISARHAITPPSFDDIDGGDLAIFMIYLLTFWFKLTSFKPGSGPSSPPGLVP